MCSVDTALNVAIFLVIVGIVYTTLGGNMYFLSNEGFGNDLKTPPCTPENYCFKGTFARSTVKPCQFLQERHNYTEKKEVDCFKESNPLLENYPCYSIRSQCVTDKHGVNRCRWVKA